VARQIVEVMERHDRGRVRPVVYNLSWSSPEEDTPLGRRIRDAADATVDLCWCSAQEAARVIADDGTDILVDMAGFTSGCRPHILAARPAPVQVNWLGYPGTLGGPWWDYALADRSLVPTRQARYWSERLCYLPHCYMPADGQRMIGAPTSRADLGLPASGMVYGCLNASNKVNPGVFDVWMRVLGRVRGSVLLLYAGHRCVPDALRREAEKRGIDPDRLVFVGPQEPPDYLAAMQQVDLFLDTWPYGAGATANDALWAGVPLLTIAGPTYVGRMAASQCRAVGLDDLVASSVRQYERWATEIGQAPDLCRDLRDRLARNRATWPLFDMGRFVRHLDDAYGRMSRRAA
jgi:predicted O-linked N-acetylglucosamine transferase (SPINDLY family)